MRFMKRYHIPINRKIGKTQEKISFKKVDSISPLKVT